MFKIADTQTYTPLKTTLKEKQYSRIFIIKNVCIIIYDDHILINNTKIPYTVIDAYKNNDILTITDGNTIYDLDFSLFVITNKLNFKNINKVVCINNDEIKFGDQITENIVKFPDLDFDENSPIYYYYCIIDKEYLLITNDKTSNIHLFNKELKEEINDFIYVQCDDDNNPIYIRGLDCYKNKLVQINKEGTVIIYKLKDIPNEEEEGDIMFREYVGEEENNIFKDILNKQIDNIVNKVIDNSDIKCDKDNFDNNNDDLKLTEEEQIPDDTQPDSFLQEFSKCDFLSNNEKADNKESKINESNIEESKISDTENVSDIKKEESNIFKFKIEDNNNNKIKDTNKIEDTSKIEDNNKIEDTNKIEDNNKITNKIEENNKIEDTNKIKDNNKIEDTNKIKDNNKIEDTNEDDFLTKFTMKAMADKKNITQISNTLLSSPESKNYDSTYNSDNNINTDIYINTDNNINTSKKDLLSLSVDKIIQDIKSIEVNKYNSKEYKLLEYNIDSKMDSLYKKIMSLENVEEIQVDLEDKLSFMLNSLNLRSRVDNEYVKNSIKYFDSKINQKGKGRIPFVYNTGIIDLEDERMSNKSDIVESSGNICIVELERIYNVGKIKIDCNIKTGSDNKEIIEEVSKVEDNKVDNKVDSNVEVSKVVDNKVVDNVEVSKVVDNNMQNINNLNNMNNNTTSIMNNIFNNNMNNINNTSFSLTSSSSDIFNKMMSSGSSIPVIRKQEPNQSNTANQGAPNAFSRFANSNNLFK